MGRFCVWLLYNPKEPEFTSTQQYTWSVLLGVVLGVAASVYGSFIETLIHGIWYLLPTYVSTSYPSFPLPLLFPLITTLLTFFTSLLLPLLPTPPTQDTWTKSIHRHGSLPPNSLLSTVLLSILSLSTGLSLGPELPLLTISSQIGSLLSLTLHQSLLSCRVITLTAASAGISSFFGFPLAGALFVLELPHFSGLEFYEALGPATLSSIIAVVCNRQFTKKFIQGSFTYGHINRETPGTVYWIAVACGILGGAVGVCYGKALLACKRVFGRGGRGPGPSGLRVALANAGLAAAVGCVCMALPECQFWGEQQLQSVLDQGATRLPFASEVEGMDGWSICKPTGRQRTTGCSIMIAVGKVITTGLSLSTGLPGGHFWAPLFVGASLANGVAQIYPNKYPTITQLLLMGSAWAPSFKCGFGIMLILTVTVRSFENDITEPTSNSNFSAVLPLLVVSVYSSLLTTRSFRFYKSQSHRGDVVSVPENLCEPGKAGQPLMNVSWSNGATPTGGNTPRVGPPAAGHNNSAYPSTSLLLGGERPGLGNLDDDSIPFYGSIEGGIIGKIDTVTLISSSAPGPSGRA
ncbi:hypothetical protein TrRE_jg6753, partial [Triparma retinervis]